ncbi:MAG TPA: cyclic lactone autoinducer peptide [Firmicutes bacterium]|uniref:Cyclic lactone autoinducer peptide n=1 Tax=Capillibacterium thermochitinicola TaxID=2699427 RepID=A0A8J6HY16_9FIRM|nr:cyclic lactone autoinducer peptide [Capillibacterium thermochitinicola]HHW11745.1 cyclic lactone autoinducer peptide [Bacillota bacterium]
MRKWILSVVLSVLAVLATCTMSMACLLLFYQPEIPQK